MSSKDYNIILYNQDKINSEKLQGRINEIYLDIIDYYLNQLNLEHIERNKLLDTLIEEGTGGTI